MIQILAWASFQTAVMLALAVFALLYMNRRCGPYEGPPPMPKKENRHAS